MTNLNGYKYLTMIAGMNVITMVVSAKLAKNTNRMQFLVIAVVALIMKTVEDRLKMETVQNKQFSHRNLPVILVWWKQKEVNAWFIFSSIFKTIRKIHRKAIRKKSFLIMDLPSKKKYVAFLKSCKNMTNKSIKASKVCLVSWFSIVFRSKCFWGIWMFHKPFSLRLVMS